MHAFRLAAAATIATATLVVAALGSCDSVLMLAECAVPTLDETGADGGPDPCHCNPPPSADFMPCGCLSDPTDQDAIDNYEACIFNFHGEEDAGDGGGP